MIKSELITLLAEKQPSLPEQDIALCVNTIVSAMSEALSEGSRIEVRGFGTFCLHYHGPRKAHNPKTGEPVLTKEKFRPHFKPGKELKEKVNT